MVLSRSFSSTVCLGVDTDTRPPVVPSFFLPRSLQSKAKHSPMDDEEMLFKQVQMTAAATPGTTVWVYRCSVYAYPWYTSVRALLDDEAYAPWFINFKADGPVYLKLRK